MRFAPAVGVCAFLLLYLIAAWLYPGGSYADPNGAGYSLYHNYWCDLLDPFTKNGRVNPGRSVAVVAMLIILPTLALFWHFVVRLFHEARELALVTRGAGYASAAATAFLLSPLHDRAVDFAGAFGLLAFVSTMLGLRRSGHGALVLGGLLAGSLSVACLFIWRTRLGLPALAALQKLAFVAFLFWMLAASLRAARTAS